jgi:amino acid transporter
MNSEIVNSRGGIERLKRNALGTTEAAGVCAAQMAPAYSLITAFAVIVAGAGLASPLVLLLAGFAMMCHINTTAEFSKAIPSSGSYTTFIGRTFGPGLGGVTGVVYVCSTILLSVSVYIIAGTWPQVVMASIFHVTIPWWLGIVVFITLIVSLCALGVRLSTLWALGLFGFEVLVLIAFAIAMVASHPASANFAPFIPTNIRGGFSGLGLAFPLAVYPFLGSSNAAAMAEEMENPRRTVARGVWVAMFAAIVIYVFVSWATIVGYAGKVGPLSTALYPLASAASAAVGSRFSWFIYVAGLTSTLSLLLVLTNAYARVWFNLAREGVLPKPLARVHAVRRTPMLMIVVFGVLIGAMTLILGATIGPTNTFDFTGSLGTTPMVVLFIVANIAVLVYYLRQRRSQFSVVRHAVVPIVGIAAFAYPLWSTINPSQVYPYNLSGLITLVAIVGGVALVAGRRRYAPGSLTVGNLTAEDEPAEMVEGASGNPGADPLQT